MQDKQKHYAININNIDWSNAVDEAYQRLQADIASNSEARQRIVAAMEAGIAKYSYMLLIGEDTIEECRRKYGDDVVNTAFDIAQKRGISFVDAIPVAQYMIWYEELIAAVNASCVSIADIARAFDLASGINTSAKPLPEDEQAAPVNRHERRAAKHGKAALETTQEWKPLRNRYRR